MSPARKDSPWQLDFDGWAPELTALLTEGETPPNGEGANLAMFDGAELGRAIAAHPDDVEAALTEYEQALFLRSTAEAANAPREFEIVFGANPPRSFLGLLTHDKQTG